VFRFPSEFDSRNSAKLQQAPPPKNKSGKPALLVVLYIGARADCQFDYFFCHGLIGVLVIFQVLRKTRSWKLKVLICVFDGICRHVESLRHTWASWHVQQGTPLFALQELGGWESPEMVRRYAHLAAEHLAPYADPLCALRAVESENHGTNTAQAGKCKRPARRQAVELLVAGTGFEPVTFGL
jgi:hypothetical protein